MGSEMANAQVPDRRKAKSKGRRTDDEVNQVLTEALTLGEQNHQDHIDHQKECAETRIEIRKAQAATDAKVADIADKVDTIVTSLDQQDVALEAIRKGLEEAKRKSDGLLKYEAWIQSRYDVDAADAARKLHRAEWWASTRSDSMRKTVTTFTVMAAVAFLISMLALAIGWDKAIAVLTVLKGG